jgi:hypothetical protein
MNLEMFFQPAGINLVALQNECDGTAPNTKSPWPPVSFDGKMLILTNYRPFTVELILASPMHTCCHDKLFSYANVSARETYKRKT